jgi:hypothetical protein
MRWHERGCPKGPLDFTPAAVRQIANLAYVMQTSTDPSIQARAAQYRLITIAAVRARLADPLPIPTGSGIVLGLLAVVGVIAAIAVVVCRFQRRTRLFHKKQD